jgi:hypothetical protein
MYGNYIETIAERFEAELTSISAEHNFDYGPDFEVVVCKFLRTVLPQKFGVCRGFAVSSSGETAGDDVIVYDRQLYPCLLLRDEHEFSRKEKIPIEGIYAYIECKHTLVVDGGTASSSCRTASKQVERVKKLVSQRKQVSWSYLDPYVERLGLVDETPEWLPKYRNPPFGMVVSRRVALKKPSSVVEDSERIHKGLLASSDIEKSAFVPDIIVCGRHNIMRPSYIGEAETGGNNGCLFHLPDSREWGYGCHKVQGLAFGYAIAHFLAALDWIRLGPLPWSDILNAALQE